MKRTLSLLAASRLTSACAIASQAAIPQQFAQAYGQSVQKVYGTQGLNSKGEKSALTQSSPKRGGLKRDTECQSTIKMMIDKTFLINFNKEVFRIVKKDNNTEVNYVELFRDNKIIRGGYFMCRPDNNGYTVTEIRNWRK